MYLKKLALLLILFLFPQTVVASNLNAELTTITQDLSDNVSIKIVSLAKGTDVFSKNAGKKLNPASVTKVVTAAAALAYMGPEHKFHTYFYITPDKDLFIKGEGDPFLVIENLKFIAQELKKRGLTYIRNIIVDDTYFSDYTAPGLSDKKSHFSSYTGALSLNYNRVRLKVAPSRIAGSPADVRADAGEEVTIKIDNQVKTSKRGTKTFIELLPPIKSAETEFVVSGRIPITSKKQETERHVSLPPLYFAEGLISILKEQRAYIAGGIYRGKQPKTAKLVYDYKSPPLSEILKGMNKFSNNFIAEQLLKDLGAIYVGTPGNTTKGVAVLKKYLSLLGITPTSHTLVNGSGLTYENRLSAEQITLVIQDMYKNKKAWPAFRDSLSIAGKDGTLRKRYRRGPLAGKLMAKTGTINGVRAIAGIVPAPNGKLYAFAILVNSNRNIWDFHKLKDKILMALATIKQ